MKRIAVALTAPLLFCANARGADAKVWTQKDETAKLAAAKPDAHKLVQDPLGSFPGYSMSVIKREADGVPELHQTKNDILVIQSGEATLVLGGTIAGSHKTAPNEIRGTSIEGGRQIKLTTGDVIHIPAKIPHQLLVASGQHVTYAVVKTEIR